MMMAITFHAMLVLLCLCPTCQTCRTCNCIEVSGSATNPVFTCAGQFGCRRLAVVWLRNEVIVTDSEVEEATISGNRVSFNGTDPSREAEWMCEVDGATSQPKIFKSELHEIGSIKTIQ